MNKKTFNTIVTIILFGSPFFAMAETTTKNFKWLVSSIITNFLTPATYLIMSFAVVFFLLNIMMVVKNSDNSEELAKFKDKAIWGVVAIAVMVTMWGLVTFVTKSVDLDTTTLIVIPGVSQ